MKKWFLVLVICLGLAVSAFSHSGGTNSFGCHVDSRTGLFHCH